MVIEREEKNAECERLMNKIVPALQQFTLDRNDEWGREKLAIQLQMKSARIRKEKERLARLETGCRFQCLNCSTTICRAEDIRVINNAHHVIIDRDANRRLRRERGNEPERIEPEGAEIGGALYCMTDTCQKKLGTLCNYMNTLFPLIALKYVRIVSEEGVGRTYKKWRDVPCEIETFTYDDLRGVAESRKEGTNNLSQRPLISYDDLSA